MKTSKVQKALCDEVITQINYWKNSNDIDSPTHLGDLYSSLFLNTEDYLSTEERDNLESILTQLLEFIRSVAI